MRFATCTALSVFHSPKPLNAGNVEEDVLHAGVIVLDTVYVDSKRIVNGGIIVASASCKVGDLDRNVAGFRQESLYKETGLLGAARTIAADGGASMDDQSHSVAVG